MTRRLVVIAGGLTGALVLIAVLWSSVGHHGGGVPVVQADQRPVRVKPANPGGMQIPGLGADVGSADDTSTGKLAPAPETPDPQALARQAPPAPPAATLTPQTPQASALPAPIAAPTAPVPAARDVAAQPPPRPLAAPAHEITKVEPPAPAGRREVQLAALTTEAAARQEWDRLARRMPGLLASRHPIVTRIDHDGHTLWRLRTGGFTTEADASQFCQQVRAKGAGCAIAAF
jgi:hypothetical protein